MQTKNLELFRHLLKTRNRNSKHRVDFVGKLLTKEESKKIELDKIKSMSREEYFAFREIEKKRRIEKEERMKPNNRFLVHINSELNNEEEE